MKSRWTTYFLLSIVIAIWSIIAWKIFHSAPDSEDDTSLLPQKTAINDRQEPDTTRYDYPDPFLKNNRQPPRQSSVRRLPTPLPQPVQKEKIRIEHIGTVSSNGETYYICLLNNRQYEFQLHESSEGITLVSTDADSLYFQKKGVRYGIQRCE